MLTHRLRSKGLSMRIRCLFPLHSSCLLAFAVWAGATMLVAPLNAEQTTLSQETFLRAKQATVGILEDTQDQRTPEKPGKIVVRGTGFHLRDGYVITARHAAEKHDPSTGTIIQKHVRVLTADLNELPADLVGDSAFMDVVIYRVAEQHRSKLQAGTAFAAGDVAPGMEVFTVGYPLGWGPTMAFGGRNTKPSSKPVERVHPGRTFGLSGQLGCALSTRW